MKNQETHSFRSSSPKATETLAAQLAQNLKGGEVIELISDLGGGKTTFARGLAHGLGSQTIVTSPTFKLSNVYESPGLSLYHFDFYRLGDDAGLMANELADALDDPKHVVVIEWADVVHDVLPSEHLRIELTSTGEHERSITVHYPETQAYLLHGMSE